MDEQQIFIVIKQKIIEVIPELSNREISTNDSLRELGANSVDRAEILIESMSALQLKVPLVDFGEAKNIADIVSVFSHKMQETK